MPDRYRTVVREPLFEEQLADLEPNARRADEFIEGLEISLARNPERGIQYRPGSPVWCQPIADVPTATPVIVYYTFDDDYVYLLSIRLTEAFPE